MLIKITHRTLATVVLVLIIVYGFFKNWVKEVYAEITIRGLDQLGLEPKQIESLLLEFSKNKVTVKDTLGWFLYYPSYFLLHVVFILLLFAENKKVRNTLIIALGGIVCFLVGSALLGKMMNWPIIYKVSYEGFQKLFGLPFILLFIEGGRILYNDIFKSET